MGKGSEHADALAIMEECARRLESSKTGLARDFQEIGGVILGVTTDVSYCGNIHGTFCEYFFGNGSDPARPNFRSEVAAAGSREIAESMDRVLAVMKANEEMGDQAMGDLRKTVDICRDLSSLIEGMRQVCIPGKGAGILPPGDEAEMKTLLGEVSGFMKDFEADYADHASIRKWMHGIHSSFLVRMKERFLELFSDMSKLLEEGSMEAPSFVNSLNDLNEQTMAIVADLQVEDIFRQNLEKIIFFSDSMCQKRKDLAPRLNTEEEPGKFAEFMLFMVHSKLQHTVECCNDFLGRFGENMNRLEGLAGACRNLIGPDGGSGRFGERMKEIQKKFGGLQKQLDSHVNKIIEMKKSMLGLQFKLIRNKNTIRDFAEKAAAVIGGVPEGSNAAKELAPVRANLARVHSEILSLNDGLDFLADSCNSGFSNQEKLLQEMLFAVKRTSQKLSDASRQQKTWNASIQKKFADMEAGLFRNEFKHSNIRKLLEYTAETEKAIASLDGKAFEFEKTEPEKFGFYLNGLRNYYDDNFNKNEYRDQMLISLLSEFSVRKNDSFMFFD